MNDTSLLGDPAETLTLEQRRRELASILAAGILRLLALSANSPGEVCETADTLKETP